jgi:nucleotide-binding universal stress UspA family protein
MVQGGVRRILVPTDFSASSAAAVEYAAAFARAFDAEVSILHVVEREEREVESETEPLRAVPRPDGFREAERKVQPILARLRAEGIRTHQRVVEGEAIAQIVKCACDEQMDLVFMGAHGREGSPRKWLGCTIERVMRRAPCPVVAVRADHQLALPRETGGARERGEEVILERLDVRSEP